jgi:hypothetical protein
MIIEHVWNLTFDSTTNVVESTSTTCGAKLTTDFLLR